MNGREEAVQKLEQKYNRDKTGLWDLLEEELGDAYDGELPTNQNTDFLHTCFHAIAAEDTPRSCLERQFDGYSREWEEDVTEQTYLATALKCLLYERVGRAKDNIIGKPTVLYLAQLVVALRTADEGPINWQANLAMVPTLESRPTHRFEPGFSFDQIETPALEEWIRSQRSETDGCHAVYVIDCTPQLGDGEDTRISGLRARVHAEGVSSKPREKGAQAVNNGECVYYVGNSDDVSKRMRQHAKPGMTDGGAQFLSLFKPVELVEVTWHETKAAAREFEKRRASELTKPGGPYAFSEINR